ncbi:MAG: carbohydrate ABC transporter permease [Chloroflexi bacterium]|nr:carbohydrate ABC transporter permease [Chloroflexota bacterium]MCY3938629.1 carbohydrate ABC transporter permease [Chloroflexota bacterium]
MATATEVARIRGRSWLERWVRFGVRATGIYVVLALMGITSLLPFFWMLSSSLKDRESLFEYPPQFIPAEPTLANYTFLFAQTNILRYTLNTAIVTVGVTAVVIILGSMAGYSFAKLEFPGRNFLFFGMLGGLMVPFEVLMIPLFILVVRMKLANTFPGIILPMAAGPFGIFVMRQYLLSIPDELLDAARVDGASEFTVFWRIVMPMSKPAVAALGTLIAIGAWNMFIWPLIVTSKEEMRVLTLAISILQLEYRGLYGTMMAAATVAFVPALAIFLLFQRYFVQGIALSGLKG